MSAAHGVSDKEGLFQFFMEAASGGMSGILDGTFWTRVLPQISASWPSIRYSVLCLSAHLRSRESKIHMAGDLTYKTKLPCCQFTVLSSTYYSRAINAMSQEVVGVNNRDITALTCVVFFCIEALYGNVSNAMSLFQRGLNLLAEARDAMITGNYFYTQLIGAVELMFARLRFAVALQKGYATNVPVLRHGNSDSESVAEFTDICATRSALHHLTAEIYSFHCQIAQNDSYDKDGILDPEPLESQIRLLTRLEIWHRRSIRYLSEAECTTSYQHLARLILRCHYVLNSIWLKCAITRSEWRFDLYTDAFSEVIDLCSAIVHLRPTTAQHTSTSPFQLETGIMLPLYVTACKCRNLSIRESALFWLKQCPAQEGLWFRDRMLSIATRICEVESAEKDDVPGIGAQWRIRYASFEAQTSASSGPFQVTFIGQREGSQTSWIELLTF